MLSALVPGNAVRFALLCVAAACAFAPQPIIWKFPSGFLQGASVAAGLAMVNSVGNLGGFVAQVAVPWVRDETASTLAPMFLMGGCLLVSGQLMLVLRFVLIKDRDVVVVVPVT